MSAHRPRRPHARWGARSQAATPALEEVSLRIDRLAAGGAGVGRLEEGPAAGLVVFVPLSAPGDRVRARVIEQSRSFARAELVEVLQSGPERAEPACSYYGRCGGCDWMHLSERCQSDARIGILRDALTRVGGFEALPEVARLPSPAPLAYRARARVAVDGDRVGFRARGSREVVDVAHCAVLESETARAFASLRAEPGPSRECEVRGFDDRVAGLSVGGGSFFQANASLWEAWPRRVAELCGAGELAVELYAGVGFLTRAIEKRFERVIAVEGARSVEDLRKNTRAQVFATSVESFVQTDLARFAPDVVLLNPPRTGCAPVVMEEVERAYASRVVYVSCDPVTLARDVARLRDRYRLTSLLSIDALPQTHHVEAVVVLERDRSFDRT